MLQQLIAVLAVLFFVSKIIWQRKRGAISRNEFIFWMFFWFLAFGAVLFIRQIDALLTGLGFSGSGIEVLFYLGVLLLFYLVLKLRINQEKLDKNITRLTREMALRDKK